MVSKVIFYAACFYAFCGNNLTLAQTGARYQYSGTQYLKNYALSSCIANGYQSREIIKDSSASANGYQELGSLPLEAYTEASLLSKKFLAKNYPSITSENLTLMKCIDLYHSKDLGNIIKKYVKNLYKKKKEKHIK